MKSILLSVIIFFSAFVSYAQSTLPQSKDELELRLNDQAFVREMMLRNPRTIDKSGLSKNLSLTDYQYRMTWDTATTSWDTLSRYTYYSQRLGAGLIEFQAYGEKYTSNGFVSNDSIYMLLDSNVNWYKNPFPTDFIVREELYFLDTVFNNYRLINERRQTINTNNDRIRSELRLHGWTPGQSQSGFVTWDSTLYTYAPNSALAYVIEYSYNFFGGGFIKDSLAVTTDVNRYPTRVSEYESVTNIEETRYTFTYDPSYNEVNRKFYFRDFSNQFSLASENRLNYVNSLLVSDSTFNGSGVLDFLTNFFYTPFNKLDTIVSYDYVFLGGLSGSWSYDYDSLNRITQQIYRYQYVNGIFTMGDRIDYTYPAATSIAEQTVKTPSFKIYPNPADDHFIISTSNLVSLQMIRISDVNGRLVKEMNPESFQQIIDISDLPNGIYFVQIGQSKAEKIIKR